MDIVIIQIRYAKLKMVKARRIKAILIGACAGPDESSMDFPFFVN